MSFNFDEIPNPPNSPIEKIPEDFLIDNVKPELLNILSDNPTKDEILRAFAFYDDALKLYIQRHEREFKYWANIHTHGGFAGGGGSAEFGGDWLATSQSLGITSGETLKSSSGAYDDWGSINSPTGLPKARSLTYDRNTDTYLWGTRAAGEGLWQASRDSFDTGSLVWNQIVETTFHFLDGNHSAKILWIDELELYVATGIHTDTHGGTSGTPAWSTDLITWNACSSSSTGFAWDGSHALAWDGEFVWVGGTGNVRGYRSDDGKSFDRSSELYREVAFCGNYSLAGGSPSSGGVQRAAIGGTFAHQTLDAVDTTQEAFKIAGTADGRAVVVSDLYCYLTDNGVDFTRTFTHGITESRDRTFITWSGSRWVAGGGEKIITSVDGENWDEVTPPESKSGYSLAAAAAPTLITS